MLTNFKTNEIIPNHTYDFGIKPQGKILSETEQPKKNKKKRNNILIFLAIFFILLGGSYGLYYYLYGQFYESTDNAYVRQNIVYVTPQISGIVDKVLVHETQLVKTGELVGRLDNRDANLSFEQAKTRLAQTVRQIKQLHQEQQEANAAIALAKVNVEKTKDILRRQTILIKNKALADETYTQSKYTYEQAYKNLKIMRQKLLSLKALVKDTPISENPEVQNAALEVKRSFLALKRCDIVAPISGTIAKKNFSIGEFVGVQSTLLAIVPTHGFWVDANFKETQLNHVQIGQNAILYSDLYGKDIIYHGKVTGISPGTGAVFSLLPTQNATGNWIKIVQRIPVRIELNPSELREHPLHVGNSMTVTIDIRKQSGKALKNIKLIKKALPSLQLYQNAIKDSEIIVKRIIKQNL